MRAAVPRWRGHAYLLTSFRCDCPDSTSCLRMARFSALPGTYEVRRKLCFLRKLPLTLLKSRAAFAVWPGKNKILQVAERLRRAIFPFEISSSSAFTAETACHRQTGYLYGLAVRTHTAPGSECQNSSDSRNFYAKWLNPHICRMHAPVHFSRFAPFRSAWRTYTAHTACFTVLASKYSCLDIRERLRGCRKNTRCWYFIFFLCL